MANGRLAWDFKGLVTAPGLLARDGASCLIANNWRFPAPGVARKREGFEQVFTTLETYSPQRVFPLPANMGGLIYFVCSATSGASIGAAQIVEAYTSGLVAYVRTAYDLRSGSSVGFADSNIVSYGLNRYILLPLGAIVRDEYNQPYPSGSSRVDAFAGMPAGSAPLVYSMNAAAFSVLTSGTLLANNASRAYRVTWHRRTRAPTTGADESVELGGPPTARLVIRNIAGTSGFTGATMDVQLRIPVPYASGAIGTLGYAQTEYFWRLWASRIETSATGTPDDEMFLVNEAFLTSADVTAGYASVTDNTPDIYLESSPRLHTNTTNFPPLEAGLLNGQANADERPPGGKCIAAFAGCLFVGATLSWPEKAFSLLTIPAAGETFSITIGGTVTLSLTAVAGAPVASTDFTVVTALATPALNIEATSRNIADAASLAFGRAVLVSCVSLGTDSQGKLRFQVDDREFCVWSASATTRARFSPNLEASASGAQIRFAFEPNSLAFSKQNRPDSFPPVNKLSIGGSSNVVRALLTFRERLLVFTDEGLYAVDGSSFADFSVTAVDLTARIICPSSVVALDDAAFAWCSDGIIEYRNGAIRRISEPIEPTIRYIKEVLAGDGLNIEGISAGFAVADPKNHEVQFWYASKANGAAGPRCAYWLAWNTRTESWSTGSRPDDTVESWIAHAAQIPGSGLLVAVASKDKYDNSSSYPFRAHVQSKGHTTGTPAASHFADDANYAATETAVSSELRLQWALADADARVHWQRTALEFEDGEQSFLLKPTALSLVWRADAQSAASSVVSLAPTTPLVEAEVPDGYRRATRSQLSITHSAKEPCGLIAVKQTFAGDGSRFPG